ncbi:MAG: serine hydrolase [Pirellulaceae bacterium]
MAGPASAQVALTETPHSAPVVSSADAQVLNDLIANARAVWDVPGLAVAIVKDDAVVLANGYGVRELGQEPTVDADTLFAIASNSKAFTAAAIAVLVDEGKLDWDDRVREFLPWFELYDRYVSDDIRVRDLLCHRSGLGTFSGDLLWYMTDYSPEEILRRARYLKPAGPFRSHYGYSNLMFVAAGQIVAERSGQSWSDFVRSRFLEPLEMRRTVTSVRDLLEKKNFATPHKTELDTSRPIAWVNWDAMAAAGGIISSVNDMSHWLRLQLRQGQLADDRRIFTNEAARQMWAPHIFNTISEESQQRFPSTHFRAYGLGWGLSDYKGRKLVTHGGGYDGMYSKVLLVPEERLGMVVLTNSMTGAPDAICYRIVDHFLGGDNRDWNQDGLERFKKSRREFAERIEKAITPVRTDTHPSHAMEQYAGTYSGPLYGDAEVAEIDGKLVLKLLPAEPMVAELEHLHYDTFMVRWREKFAWFDAGTATFIADAAGNIVEMKLDIPNDDLWFHELEFKR